MSEQPPQDPYSAPAPDPYPGYAAPPQPPPGYAAPPQPPPGYQMPSYQAPVYPQGPGYPQGYAPAPPPATNGLAVGALILGILALLACWIPFFGLLLPVVGLVLGFLGLRRAGEISVGRGLAITGLVLSAVALLVCVVWTIVVVAFVRTHHPHILNCTRSDLTPAQQQQCIRDDLGIPSISPS